jgi:excisionase family DNA binding protein
VALVTVRPSGAFVVGSDAFLLAVFLDRAGVDAFLGRIAATVHASRVASFRDMLDTVRAAAAEYESFAGESAKGPAAKASAQWGHEVEEWVSAKEAAQLLDVHPARVCQLVRDGRLEWRRPGREYLVTRESVLLYRDSRRRRAA